MADPIPYTGEVYHSPSGGLQEIVVYENSDFQAAEWRTNLGWRFVGDFWNDKISSFVVVRGVWQFYAGEDFGGCASREFGPGVYQWVEAFGIPNDSISSFRCLRFE